MLSCWCIKGEGLWNQFANIRETDAIVTLHAAEDETVIHVNGKLIRLTISQTINGRTCNRLIKPDKSSNQAINRKGKHKGSAATKVVLGQNASLLDINLPRS